MSNPRVIAGFDATSTSPTLSITWDVGTERGAELPDKYFVEVDIQSSKDDLVKSVTFKSNPKSITLAFEPLTDFLAANDLLNLVLVFPDREGYINCKHPASPDKYLLDITLKFNQAELTSAAFTQYKYLGPF